MVDLTVVKLSTNDSNNSVIIVICKSELVNEVTFSKFSAAKLIRNFARKII